MRGIKQTKESIKRLFWLKINIKTPEECWNWKGSISSNGYGRFYDGTSAYAHRVAWELHNNRKVPYGLVIMHTCDNPACCNPAHLHCGTPAENTQDMFNKGRGETNTRKQILGMAIFSVKYITAIRKLKGKVSQRAAARKFNVSHHTVGNMWNLSEYPCKEGYYI
jgi:hypothetical protein